MPARVYYIDPTHGDDANGGLSPARPLKSYASLEVRPGDALLFKRGSVIRDMVHTRNGVEGAPVTYGAYGDGEKPTFLGSVAVGDPGAWTEVRPNVWRFMRALGSEVCNLVFNGGESCGILCWEPEDLRQPGDWHYTAIGRSSGGEETGGKDAANGDLSHH